MTGQSLLHLLAPISVQKLDRAVSLCPTHFLEVVSSYGCLVKVSCLQMRSGRKQKSDRRFLSCDTVILFFQMADFNVTEIFNKGLLIVVLKMNAVEERNR